MTTSLTVQDDELRKGFLALSSPRDVAVLLDVPYSQLVWHLFRSPKSIRYNKFQIQKKSGGVRDISSPTIGLLLIQRKLNQVLQSVFEPRPCVHGFVRGRSIKSNAAAHRRRRYVFNLDLKGFFPAINFGRVRGLFRSPPYGLDDKVSTVLAQICCFENELPQGAPTSPTVSNMISAKMDRELQILAVSQKCTYTRYADDMTFSTSEPEFPTKLAVPDAGVPSGKYLVGPSLEAVINSNGFQINAKKTRLQIRPSRQSVTGLTVNNQRLNVRRKYVRQIQSMLYSWHRWGLPKAEERYLLSYNSRQRNPVKTLPKFRAVVRGKIAFLRMVKGKDDKIYRKFSIWFQKLDSNSNYNT